MNTDAAIVALYGAPLVVLLAAIFMAWRNHVVMRRAHRRNGRTDAMPLRSDGIATAAFEGARGVMTTPQTHAFHDTDRR